MEKGQPDLFPFNIKNIRPDYSAEKIIKLEKNIQSELYYIFKKYCKWCDIMSLKEWLSFEAKGGI